MKRLLIILGLLLFIPLLVMADTLKIIVPEDVLEDYLKFVNGKMVLKITDFTGESSRRDVVEIVLLQQALFEGGMLSTVEFVKADSYARIQKEMEAGTVAMSGTTLWNSDLEGMKTYVYISFPTISNGEFEAGLYTLPSHTNALSAKTLTDVQQFAAITNKAWIVDWRTLIGLNLKKVENTVKWTSMVKMINAGRADFVLAPFQSTDDFSLEVENIKLIPIPNLKVGLQGSRHFGVSKTYPNGKQVFQALNKGIQILKDRGIIRKAYQQSGFFNHRVANWKKIN